MTDAPLIDAKIRRLLLGGGISGYGDALQNAAQGWLAVQLTHSARGVGLFAMAWMLPRVLVSLFAGVLVDRYARATILRWAVIGGTTTAALFCAAVLTGRLSFPVLLVLALGFALSSPFEIISRNTLLPTLAVRSQIPRIVALNFFVMYCAELLGLVTGGLLLSWVGAIGCVALNLATYVAYLVAVAEIPATPLARPTQGLHRAFLEGVRFVAGKRKAAVPLLVGALFAVIGFHFDRSTLPLFLLEDLHATARQYGVLLAAAPLGAVALLGLTRPSDARRLTGRIIASAIAVGVGFLLLALSRRPAMTFPILLGLGAARGMHYNAIATLLQMKVPEAFRGRMFSFYSISGGLFGLGGLLMGWVAGTFGKTVSAHLGALRGVPDVHGLRGALAVAAFVAVAAALALTRPLRSIVVHESYTHTEDLQELQARAAEISGRVT